MRFILASLCQFPPSFSRLLVFPLLCSSRRQRGSNLPHLYIYVCVFVYRYATSPLTHFLSRPFVARNWDGARMSFRDEYT